MVFNTVKRVATHCSLKLTFTEKDYVQTGVNQSINLILIIIIIIIIIIIDLIITIIIIVLGSSHQSRCSHKNYFKYLTYNKILTIKHIYYLNNKWKMSQLESLIDF